MSGSVTLVRTPMGLTSIRVYAVTGAPRRSTPKKGKDWGNLPSRKAAWARSSEAMTAPWPPRPWKRSSITIPPEEPTDPR